MQATFHREGLLAACQIAHGVVPARDVKPVLRHLKILVQEGRGTLLATDTEVGVRLEVRGVQTSRPGETLVPADRFLSILRELTDDEVTLEAEAEKTLLHGQSSEFEMLGSDPADFPDFPDFAEEKYHELAAGVLRELIRRTLFAVSTGAAHYGATTGVLWELKEDKVRLVATDGHRLALAEGPAQAHAGHNAQQGLPVVPVKALSLLERNLQEPEETVRVSFRPNEVLLKTERATIYSRLVEGRFPEYERVLPQKCPHKVALTAGPLYAAVRQAAIMADEESKKVVFTFTPGKLRLEARGAAAGRSKVELVVPYEGKKFEIAFNPKLLSDMLRVLEEDTELSLEMTGAEKPALFRTPDNNYLYVVMPMQLGEYGER